MITSEVSGIEANETVRPYSKTYLQELLQGIQFLRGAGWSSLPIQVDRGTKRPTIPNLQDRTNLFRTLEGKESSLQIQIKIYNGRTLKL